MLFGFLIMSSAWLASATSVGTPALDHRRYVYYLHGKIVEDSGPRGVSPRFGAYDYPGIVAALHRGGLTVISEVRARNTDPSTYADKVVAHIRRQIARGVPPSQITVVGASRGSVIATLVSTRLHDRRVRYVLLA